MKAKDLRSAAAAHPGSDRTAASPFPRRETAGPGPRDALPPGVPGQGTPDSPAGLGAGRGPAAGAAPAGTGESPLAAPASTPRTWVIEMPAGTELLNSNDRDSHWARRNRVTEGLRATAGWLARRQQIPALGRAHVLAVYEPPDRRRRDPANLYPSVKAIVDGLVDARVLPDDDAAHLEGPDMRLGKPHARGRLVLHITEVSEP